MAPGREPGAIVVSDIDQRGSVDPLDELPDDPVGVGELAIPLAPWLGLGLGHHSRPGGDDAGVLIVEVVDDEDEQKALPCRPGVLGRPERAEPRLEEDDVPSGRRVRERYEPGPGTIAKYDRELATFDGLRLDDLQRDAALSFVLDFARAGALRRLEAQSAGALDWDAVATPLAGHLGEKHPLAQRVGAAAGAELDGAYDPDAAWRFGLDRVLDGLARIIEQGVGTTR